MKKCQRKEREMKIDSKFDHVFSFNLFQELLGDRLVTSPLSEVEQWLPSPNQLRNRQVPNLKMKASNS